MPQKVKIAVGVIVLVLLAYAALALDIPYRNKIDDFATCIAAGNPAMESFPRQCRDAKSGKTYVEELPQATSSDMIRIDSPAQGAGISSPGHFSGKARGTWFFEAVFPVEIVGDDGTVLGKGSARAQGEWMTSELVPWLATVSFDAKGRSTGAVRFMKDNPSGLPENNASVEIPVRFVSSGTGTTTAAACKPTGCSGQICSDQNVVSTCEFRQEYACYKSTGAKCERQPSGQCGWTETSALALCLKNAKSSI